MGKSKALRGGLERKFQAFLLLIAFLLEFSVYCLDLGVNYLELGRSHSGFARACLHFWKMQIESRQINLEL